MKYPRTYHLPFSPGKSGDDVVMPTLVHLLAGPVVITEKMDGENTTMTNARTWARSVDSRTASYQSWLKQYHASIRYKIPDGVRVCGEYLYAKHSLGYDNLPSYFMCFNAWEWDRCLSWDETCILAERIGLAMVPVLFMGMISEHELMVMCDQIDTTKHEGLVVRSTGDFMRSEFKFKVGKYVRPNHVTTDERWEVNIVKNGLIKNQCV